MTKKDTLKEVVDKIWPKTKQELEKGVENAKTMLAKGEKHLKDFSEKGIERTKKISLSLKKEKLCYSLGKLVAANPVSKWKSDEKINSLVKEIKDIDKQIKKIK